MQMRAGYFLGVAPAESLHICQPLAPCLIPEAPSGFVLQLPQPSQLSGPNHFSYDGAVVSRARFTV